jgi:hypothetical protein
MTEDETQSRDTEQIVEALAGFSREDLRREIEEVQMRYEYDLFAQRMVAACDDIYKMSHKPVPRKTHIG